MARVPDVSVKPPENVLTPKKVTVLPAPAAMTTAPFPPVELSVMDPE